MKERIIKYNGLDLKVTIDTDEMIEKVRNQYRPVIYEMRKIIDKRNKYISKLHKLMKDKESAMFLFIDAVQIQKKAKKLYGLGAKSYMVLTHMYKIRVCVLSQLERYIKSIGFQGMSYAEMKTLVRAGYITELPDKHFGITDKGSKVIDTIYNAFRQDYDYFLKNKVTGYTAVNRKRTENKYTEEQKKQRGDFYRKMMRPFWDGGYKMMPKDKNLRVDYMLKWMEKKAKEGEELDEMYMRLVTRWSSAEPKPPRLASIKE